MLIYGTGEHGKVVYDCLIDNQVLVKAFFDDGLDKDLFFDRPVYEYKRDLFLEEEIIISIGSNKSRKEVFEKISHKLANIFHSSSIVSQNAKIEKGSMVMHGAIIQTGCQIGKCVIINTGATVDHDCVVDDFVHIAPNSTLCGNVTVGEGTLVGAGSVIIPGIRVGKWCVVGAGSVVVKDVPDYSLVMGNPAKVIKSIKV